MDRQILCFSIPSFEIALARRQEPRLVTRPVAIAPLVTPRARLCEVSREAEQDGVSVGMSLEEARRRCRALVVVPPDPTRVQRATEALLPVITHYAPLWEPVAPGSFLLDVTGTKRLFGPACDIAVKVQRAIVEQTRLEGLAGLGSNKLVAQTAARLVEPAELYAVRAGSERAFMAPLPIRLLPGLQCPCMRPVLARLDDLNLRTLGEVADSPLEALTLALGDAAGPLSQWARGIDHTPVFPPAACPSLEATATLESEEIEDAVLWGRLSEVLQRLCRTLRSQRRVCRLVSLTIRYSDQVEVTRQARVLPETCWEADLSPVLASLFQRSFRRRIRLCQLTVSLTGLADFAEQRSLFEEPPRDDQLRRARARALAVALDQLQARFGERAIRYGRSL
ncbi:DNA polymerase Y family protein [Nitrospira sp. Kam-Ns4a]